MAAIALHGLAAGALLAYEPSRTAMLSAAPIMVELISPSQIRPAAHTRTEEPRPRTVAIFQPVRAPVPAIPVVATTSEPAVQVAAAPAPATTVASARPAPSAEPATAMPAPVTPPVFDAGYLDNPAPAYPPLSRRMREEGRVTLRVLVTPTGTADEVHVRTSSGAARLDAAALETVRRWKFVPAKRGAEAVPAWVLIPISFKLES
jgi:protein TonB